MAGGGGSPRGPDEGSDFQGSLWGRAQKRQGHLDLKLELGRAGWATGVQPVASSLQLPDLGPATSPTWGKLRLDLPGPWVWFSLGTRPAQAGSA